MATLAADRHSPARPGPAEPDGRRWLILGVIALAQLMVVLDATVVTIALPSAQRSLHFTTVDRQWIITAYALAFGSLLLLGGKLADLAGRKVTFLLGVLGFAAASAAGGAATSFGMLVAARASQGLFGALLAPSALSLLTTTFSDPRERGKAFGVYSAVAGAGGAVGLLLGGALTEYMSWRWTLYVNLVFAGIAAVGGLLLLRRQPSRGRSRLDLLGAALVSGGMFCLVYGFSNAAMHGWHARSTWGFLAAGGVLLVLFGGWQARARQPLLPPRVVTDRNRAGAYLSMLIAGIGMFGIFLFLAYYMQLTLHFSPVKTGLAFLPMVGMIMLFANLSTIVAMPRIGPRPLIPAGMLAAAAGLAWLTRLSVDSHYTANVLPPILLAGMGLGLIFAPVFNTGTYGVAPSDAGVASATVNTGQQIGGSIGTSLLNTIAASATASYLTADISHTAGGRPSSLLAGMAVVHGYTTAFWVAAAIFAGGALVAATVLRSGPLTLTALAAQARPVSQDALAGDSAPAGAGAAGAAELVPNEAVTSGPAAGTVTDGRAGEAVAARRAVTAGAQVAGHVRRTDGVPVPGTTLTLIGPDGRQAGRARAGTDGGYAITAPRPGPYTLIAMAGGYQPQAQTVIAGGAAAGAVIAGAGAGAMMAGGAAAGAVIAGAAAGAVMAGAVMAGGAAGADVTLPGASSLTGTVRTAGTGRPLAGAAASLAGPDGEVVAGQTTDDAGRYRFADLIPGSYTLAVAAPGHQPAALPVTVADGEPAVRDADLDGGSAVAGTARTPAGAAIPDALITLLDRDGNVAAVTTTGADGGYAIAGLPSGDYTVIASGYPPAASPITIAAGPAQVHDVRLSHQEAPSSAR
jgi:EmrB/QacA subfamily drug resistance transporter